MTTTPHLVEKLDSLTSLRFFAAMMIVMVHSADKFGIPANTHFALGQGVSFFFVLSGFILTWNYPVLDNRHSLSRFWLARIARIWPSSVVALALGLATFGFHPTDYTIPIEYTDIKARIFILFTNLTLLQNIVPFYHLPSIGYVSWTLSIEVFFCLLLPILLIAHRSRSPFYLPVIILALIFFVVSMICLAVAQGGAPVKTTYLSNGYIFLYMNPLARLLEFVVGIASCYAFVSLREQLHRLSFFQASVIELCAISSTVAVIWLARYLLWWKNPNLYLGYLTFYFFISGGVIIFPFLISIMAAKKGLFSSILRYKIFVFLGEISFALYLVHLLTLFHYEALAAAGAIPGFTNPYSYFLYVGSCLIAASLLHLTVEKPARRFILGLPDRLAHFRHRRTASTMDMK